MSQNIAVGESPEFREFLDRLQEQGLDLRMAQERDELESYCREHRPGLVLFDRESSLELLPMIRKWKVDPELFFPAVAVAGKDWEEIPGRELLRVGANLVLELPALPIEPVVDRLQALSRRFDEFRLPREQSFRIHTLPAFLQESNQMLDELLLGTSAQREHLEDLRLCLGELGTNAIVHGNGDDPTKKVEVQFRIEASSLRVSIQDEGPGFDPGELPDPTSPERLLVPSGRGIFLVRQFTDELSFNEKGNQVHFLKLLA